MQFEYAPPLLQYGAVGLDERTLRQAAFHVFEPGLQGILPYVPSTALVGCCQDMSIRWLR